MCVSLSRTRSLDMDDELLAPPAAPAPAIPGVLLVQVLQGLSGGSHVPGFRWRRGGAHAPPVRETSAVLPDT